jgi:hypothetical protein
MDIRGTPEQQLVFLNTHCAWPSGRQLPCSCKSRLFLAAGFAGTQRGQCASLGYEPYDAGS